MTIEEADRGMKKLQASYPTMAKLDEASVTAYVQEIIMLRWDDFAAGAKEIVQTSKFFPSIAELLEASSRATRKRLDAKEHTDRESRLALQSAEDKIMDPKSGIHRVIQGPNHQRFLDMISGKIKLSEPEWMHRGQAKERQR